VRVFLGGASGAIGRQLVPLARRIGARSGGDDPQRTKSETLSELSS